MDAIVKRKTSQISATELLLIEAYGKAVLNNRPCFISLKMVNFILESKTAGFGNFIGIRVHYKQFGTV